jgi:hypothetical protein
VIAFALQSRDTHEHRSVDYLGAGLLAGGLSAVVLFTSLGGTTYAWGSIQTIGFAVLGVVLLALFVVAESRAEEPILPLALFRNRIFAVTSAIGFIIGLALFGAVTYLPLYLQIVKGRSATESGLLLTPMMAGVLVTSIASGNLISKTGRYKPFPSIGTAVAAFAMFLLSRLAVSTPLWLAAVYLLVLGLGLGMVMQVLVLAAQNAVPYEMLGVATSGSTLFRQIGGAVGVAIFGATATASPRRARIGPTASWSGSSARSPPGACGRRPISGSSTTRASSWHRPRRGCSGGWRRATASSTRRRRPRHRRRSPRSRPSSCTAGTSRSTPQADGSS